MQPDNHLWITFRPTYVFSCSSCCECQQHEAARSVFSALSKEIFFLTNILKNKSLNKVYPISKCKAGLWQTIKVFLNTKLIKLMIAHRVLEF